MTRGTARQRRRAIRQGLAVMTAATLALFATLWLAFQHRPGWYRPSPADEVTVHRAQAESAGVADTVSRQMVEGAAFELVVADRAVNEWLAALPVLWPDARAWFPEQFKAPAVSFDDGVVRLGGHVEHDGWKVVASIGLRLALSEGGEYLTLALHDVRGGSLPLPRATVRAWLGPFLDSVRREEWSDEVTSDPVSAAFRRVHDVDDLYRGVQVPNRFVWPNGERPFRVTAVRVEGGELRLGIRPL
ncbi:MAG: hypothetical protein HY763_02580 [Planctomycetes bacterium]|nr:hypothetical protein [Planctomycetota bacterium]